MKKKLKNSYTNNMKEKLKKYYPYFVDVWQYLLIIVIFIIAILFIL